MKRVYALYRVSTAKQVDHVTSGNTTKDDIPMQRIACHNFAERQQDWEIIREFEEKGVSGFKVSAENRDANDCYHIYRRHHNYAKPICHNIFLLCLIVKSLAHNAPRPNQQNGY